MIDPFDHAMGQKDMSDRFCAGRQDIYGLLKAAVGTDTIDTYIRLKLNLKNLRGNFNDTQGAFTALERDLKNIGTWLIAEGDTIDPDTLPGDRSEALTLSTQWLTQQIDNQNKVDGYGLLFNN